MGWIAGRKEGGREVFQSPDILVHGSATNGMVSN